MVKTVRKHIDDLVPAQVEFKTEKLKEVRNYMDLHPNDPLDVLAVMIDGKTYIGDGYHRIYESYCRGSTNFEINVIETDEEVVKAKRGCFLGSRSLKQVENYVFAGERDCLNAGIYHFKDYKDHIDVPK